MLSRFRGRRILLLQGPSSPFFRRVADRLESVGATVTKVNFNAGDWLYYHRGTVIAYRGTFEEWPEFVSQVISIHQIDIILLFGDCRPLHRAAVDTASKFPIQVFAFEEGYLRPDFVTLEQDGVNGNSKIPRDPEFFRRYVPRPTPPPSPLPSTFWLTAWYCTLYAWALTLFWWRYPHYRHHRNQNAPRQLFLWTRSGIRKLRHWIRDRKTDRRIVDDTLGTFFLVPLQVHFDSQLEHSPYSSVAAFICDVVESFARHAPSDALLVLKHHPFDRPYQEYTQLIRELRSRHALAERLIYADVVNLPAALRHARGTVVINSTVGLSSIHHNTPTKCMGMAIYDIPGLTSQQPLSEFWVAPTPVDRSLYSQFRAWLIENNQLNGSIWLDLVDADSSRRGTAKSAPKS